MVAIVATRSKKSVSSVFARERREARGERWSDGDVTVNVLKITMINIRVSICNQR
jgi:hypothetical protein